MPKANRTSSLSNRTGKRSSAKNTNRKSEKKDSSSLRAMDKKNPHHKMGSNLKDLRSRQTQLRGRANARRAA